ncbi:MAG: phage holin family protein [Candidatus Peribacteraceae bacterium]|jgi:putative membrane protein
MTSSLPVRLILRTILNVLLVWVLTAYLPDYFFVHGGWIGAVIIGALLTLMNVLVRPLLDLLTTPLKLLATLVAFILVNGVFLWLTALIASMMDPALVSLQISGGVGGWIVVMIVLGIANWLMKILLK